MLKLEKVDFIVKHVVHIMGVLAFKNMVKCSVRLVIAFLDFWNDKDTKTRLFESHFW